MIVAEKNEVGLERNGRLCYPREGGIAMKPEELLEIARGKVPDHLKPLGRIVSPPVMNGELAADIAAAVGVVLPADDSDEDSAEVEFLEMTPLGERSNIVQIRRGVEDGVLKNG